jgi:hypothetical protein
MTSPSQEASPTHSGAPTGSLREREIDVTAYDWARLESLASKYQGPKATPVQIAGILLNLALDAVQPTDSQPDPPLRMKLFEAFASQPERVTQSQSDS